MPDYTLSKVDGAPISKERADLLMQRFRDKHPGKETVVARFIGTDQINNILGQGNCVGLRIYFGYDDNGQLDVFLIGALANGNNIGPIGSQGPQTGIMSDQTMPCPPYCP